MKWLIYFNNFGPVTVLIVRLKLSNNFLKGLMMVQFLPKHVVHVFSTCILKTWQI